MGRKRGRIRRNKAGLDPFSHLPRDVFINILSRLSLKSVVCCNLVRKSWSNLLLTSDFAKVHVSKSVPKILVHQSSKSSVFKIFDLEDSPEPKRHDRHYRRFLKLELGTAFKSIPSPTEAKLYGSTPSEAKVISSTRGLLFLEENRATFYLCNPMTLEYCKLPYFGFSCCCCGFGVSRDSNIYKVVVICQQLKSDDETSGSMKTECLVYDLGEKESWRDVDTHVEELVYSRDICGVFLNGKIHWLVREEKTGSVLISCFELETENFSTFSAPVESGSFNNTTLSVVRDCLCACDSSLQEELVLHVMERYGDENSWSKCSFIKGNEYSGDRPFYPTKFFSDGDVLMEYDREMLVCYSAKSRIIESINLFNEIQSPGAVIFTPSFVSLKGLGMKGVKAFGYSALRRWDFE